MLRYDVKLSDDNLKRDELVWSEKYVSPDLSFVSGVTSQHYHIDRSETIAASIGADTNFSALGVETENVTRNGYIIIKNKVYDIETGSKQTDGSSFEYVYINGVYYYITSETTSITVKNWLKESWSVVDDEYKVEIVEGDVEASFGSFEGKRVVVLDTIVWIENDTVTVDGNTYIFDRYDNGTVVDTGEVSKFIKYYPGGRTLLPSEVTRCDDITANYFENESDYIYVTKFKLTKDEDKDLVFDNISYCTYFYYVLYKGYYCPIRMGDSGLTCDVPTRLIDDSSSYGDVTTFDVTDVGGEPLDITRISQLKSYDAIVTIPDGGTPFKVEYMLQNSNYGDELVIYLNDGTHNLSEGETIVLECSVDDKYTVPVYRFGEDEDCDKKESEFLLERYGLIVKGDSTSTTSEGTTGGDSTVTNADDFVLYKNTKYYLEENIADTVTINKVEYNVYYPNGVEEGVDALVDVDGEMIPMKLVKKTSVSSSDEDVDVARYEINKYDGVIINDEIYTVFDNGNCNKYIEMTEPIPYEFVITSIEGSSLLICTPKFNESVFTPEFVDNICPQICEFFVSNKADVKVVTENRAFGTKPIRNDVGYLYSDNPVSSTDYFNILDSLVLFVNTGYIQVSLPLTMNVANNAMQDDIVERDFYETEKEKAINPIVDMEKDVYVPKYISVGEPYAGSSTDFFPVNQIEVNLHFRTRNMDSWKVNDGYNDVSTSGKTDNWFCTDWYPYSELIGIDDEERGINGAKTVMNTSDLVGLLWFTNDDVFYQRDKIAKSFLRFSYYDSTDPNTQSLLATSTVFMDENSLYKKYIDNSRKNISDFGIVTDEPHYDGEDYYGDGANKISVFTEWIKNHIRNKMPNYSIKDFNKENVDKIENDKNRLSSKFIIDNKYSTDTSAEGFYLYIFREYSENLHPKPIYMKIEFNHAGVGRTIPFIVPMKWDNKSQTSNMVYPTRRLSLSDEKTEENPVSDLDELKKGYPLSFVYAQTYIPLYAVYDFKNNEYAYVFDNRYIDLDTKTNTVRLNLFELKIMNEDTADENDRASVRNNDVLRGVIDVNDQFFNK